MFTWSQRCVIACACLTACAGTFYFHDSIVALVRPPVIEPPKITKPAPFPDTFQEYVTHSVMNIALFVTLTWFEAATVVVPFFFRMIFVTIQTLFMMTEAVRWGVPIIGTTLCMYHTREIAATLQADYEALRSGVRSKASKVLISIMDATSNAPVVVAPKENQFEKYFN